MLRRRALIAGALAAPAIVERANAQSKFDWKQAKGTKLEVNFGKHPSADIMQAHQKEFEELTGIKVGSEQVPEQQQRPKVAMELSTGRPSFDVVSISLHVQKKLIEKGGWMEDLRPYINDASKTNPDFDFADWSPGSRVLPQEFAVEATARAVELELDRRDVDDALERVQLRAGHEGVEVAAVLGARARELGVAQPRCVAHARQQAARALHAERVDQLLAQQRLRLGVDEQHAVLVEPDLPGLGTEVHARAQVVARRARNAVEFAHDLAVGVRRLLLVLRRWGDFDLDQGFARFTK